MPSLLIDRDILVLSATEPFQATLAFIWACRRFLSSMYDNFEKSLVVFMPNITTNHAITYTNYRQFKTIIAKFRCK